MNIFPPRADSPVTSQALPWMIIFPEFMVFPVITEHFYGGTVQESPQVVARGAIDANVKVITFGRGGDISLSGDVPEQNFLAVQPHRLAYGAVQLLEVDRCIVATAIDGDNIILHDGVSLAAVAIL
jgi:hypothetical protein